MSFSLFQQGYIVEKITTNSNDLRNKSLDTFGQEGKKALSSSLNHAENGLDQVKEVAMNSLNDAKGKWLDLEHAIVTKSQEASKAGRIYIYQNPFKSVLAASGAGLVIGFLLSMLRK